MTLREFQIFVASRSEMFQGVHPHLTSDFNQFEQELKRSLPISLRWLLGTQGYSDFCGVDNLEEAVKRTLACRTSMSLPLNWLLLNDWGDGGIVLLDLATECLCWCAAHNLHRLADGEIDSDADWFDGYPEWVVRRLADAE